MKQLVRFSKWSALPLYHMCKEHLCLIKHRVSQGAIHRSKIHRGGSKKMAEEVWIGWVGKYTGGKSSFRLYMDAFTHSRETNVNGNWHLPWAQPKKRFPCPITCVNRDAENESSSHILFSCGLAVSICRSWIFWNQLSLLLIQSDQLASVLFGACNILSQANLQQFCVTIFFVWSAQTMEWQSVGCEPDFSSSETLPCGSKLGEYKNRSQVWLLSSSACWKVPQTADGYLKCNADASFFQQMQTVGPGMCVRDHLK